MSLDYLNEAFKKLEMISLNEETFNTSFTGLNDLAAFMDGDDTSDLIKVIDPDATIPEKLEDSYVGKVITRCNVCHSNIFNNKEEIVIDDDGDVNPESQCPYCGEFSGFTILGEICPFNSDAAKEAEESAEEEIDVPEVKEVEEAESVELEESLEPCAPTSIESYLNDVEDGEGWVTIDKALSDLEMLGCTTTVEEFKNFLTNYKRAYILTFGGIDVVFTPTAPSYDTVGKELGIEESDLTEAIALKEKRDFKPHTKRQFDNAAHKRIVESSGNSWQNPDIFYDLFKSKDPKIGRRAAYILYDWYSAEDAFSDFTSERDFLNFVRSDLADMFDAADSAEEVRTVIEALIGLRLKDFVAKTLPEANKKITGYENPTAKQIWKDADATLDDYSDYMIDKIIEITDCSSSIGYFIRNYIESIIDKILPDEESDLTEAVAKSIAEDSHEADTEKIYTLSCTGPDLHDAITLGKVPMYLKNVKEVELIDWDRVPVKKYNQICRFLHDLGIKVTKGASGREPTEAVALKENRSDFKPHTKRLLKLIGSNLLNDTDILEEDFKEVSIKTEDQHLEMTSDENGKVTVVSEPLNSDEGEIEATTDEMITPVSDETISEIEAQNAPEEEDAAAKEGSEENPTSEEEEELDFEEVDENALDELGEAYLHKVYENVESFKTTNVALSPKNFIVEGLIKFTSGTKKKTGFVFNEAQIIQNSPNIKFLGENLQLSRGKKAFGLSGKIVDKKFFAESLSYNYRTSNVKDSANRVSGVVTRK